MKNTSKLGNNIRSLRLAHGETQEQLAAIFNSDKNRIHNYETGQREPKQEVLATIAEHYLVSVEELLTSDFSGLNKISVNPYVLSDNIYTFFPIASSSNAMTNDHFQMASNLHKEMYEQLQERSIFFLENLDTLLEEYFYSFEDPKSREESAANLIGIRTLLCAFFNKHILAIVENQPAALKQAMLKDSNMKKAIENFDPSFEEAIDAILDIFDDSEINKAFSDCMCTIKKSAEWYELADYYLAMQYLFGTVDNDLSFEYNNRIGLEMLTAFTTVKNKYALRFLSIY